MASDCEPAGARGAAPRRRGADAGGDAARTARWAALVGVDAVRSRLAGDEDTASFYRRHAGAERGAARLSKSGLEGEIRRDVPRTFGERTFFGAAGGAAAFSRAQDALADVLAALAEADAATCYCQGMNLVAAALLEVHATGSLRREAFEVYNEAPDDALGDEAPDVTLDEAPDGSADGSAAPEGSAGEGPDGCGMEPTNVGLDEATVEADAAEADLDAAAEAVFWLMLALADAAPADAPAAAPVDDGGVEPRRRTALELAELWRPGMPQLKLRVFQFDRLVCLRLPRLRAHLKEVGLAPDVLASQWFLTLFAYALPTHWLKRVWDCVFAGGWAAIYKIALARLTLAQSALLDRGLDDVGKFLRDRRALCAACKDGVESLLEVAEAFDVTDETLADVAEDFGFALIEERLDLASGPSQGDDSPYRPAAEWLARYGGEANDVLGDADAAALRLQLSGLDSLATSDAECVRLRIDTAERDSAEAADAVRKCADAAGEARRRVGFNVDQKRLLLKTASDVTEVEAATLRARRGDAPWLRYVCFLSARRRPGSPYVGAASYSFAMVQQSAASIEAALVDNRKRLAKATEALAHAQGDLDEAQERKAHAQAQLERIVADSHRRRRSAISNVFDGAESHDLKLVARLVTQLRPAPRDAGESPRSSVASRDFGVG